MIRRLMHAWEQQLSTRDKNRVTLPFEWGIEFLDGYVPKGEPKESVLRFNEAAIKESHQFFLPSSLEKYELEGDRLYFSSSIQTPYPENNTASCRIFPATRTDGAAVIVLPQWNADQKGHVALCRLLSRLGMTTLRLTLPYHEERNPGGPRADFLVSPNIGRTIQAIRQAVHDARSAADWLILQGYQRIGIMGTSVGSCISFLTYVHDERFCAGVFNHVSSFFGDVVWNGISTQHVRRGIEGSLTQQELHDLWAIISPNSFVCRLNDSSARKCLFISARYDLTFPPDLARLLMEEHDRCRVPYDVAYLPCGHYTSALTPFKQVDGFLIASYLRKHLR